MKGIFRVFAPLLRALSVCAGRGKGKDKNMARGDVKVKKISDVTKKFIDYLGCDCSYVGHSNDMKAVTGAYYAALEKGKAEGFTPVMIGVDGIIAESIAAAVSDGDEMSFELGRAYRERLLSEDMPDVRAVMSEREREFGYLFDSFFEEEDTTPSGVWTGDVIFANGVDTEIIIANIPTSEPWKVFAWVPFAGFNDCPSNGELMAVSEYWYRLYRAYPAYISYDRLEYHVECPVGEDKVMALSDEHMLICPTITEFLTPSEYAGSINGARMWSFWWD